jgi:hypothetical protein
MLNPFKQKKAPSKEAVLNAGYSMTQEFGKNWLQPIDQRLQAKFPMLTQDEAHRINETCVQLRNGANSYIYERLTQLTDNNQQISEKELILDLSDWILKCEPWVSKTNIKQTFNQSMYYAWRDGITDCVK